MIRIETKQEFENNDGEIIKEGSVVEITNIKNSYHLDTLLCDIKFEDIEIKRIDIKRILSASYGHYGIKDL